MTPTKYLTKSKNSVFDLQTLPLHSFLPIFNNKENVKVGCRAPIVLSQSGLAPSPVAEPALRNLIRILNPAQHPRIRKSCPHPAIHHPRLPAMSAARAFSTAFRAGAPRAPMAARYAATRSYAAAAQSGAAIKPPVALFGVDGTYASALVRFSRLQLGVLG